MRIIRVFCLLILCFFSACNDSKQSKDGIRFKSKEEIIYYYTKSGFILERVDGYDYDLKALNSEKIQTINNTIQFLNSQKIVDQNLLFYTKVAASVVDNRVKRMKLIEKHLLGKENQQHKTLVTLSNLAKYQPEIQEFSQSLENILPLLSQEDTYNFLTAISFIGQESLNVPEYDIGQIKHLSNNNISSLSNNLSKGKINTEFRKLKVVLNAYISKRSQ